MSGHFAISSIPSDSVAATLEFSRSDVRLLDDFLKLLTNGARCRLSSTASHHAPGDTSPRSGSPPPASTRGSDLAAIRMEAKQQAPNRLGTGTRGMSLDLTQRPRVRGVLWSPVLA